MSQENQAAQEASIKKMIKMPIKTEAYREYSWICPVSKERVVYRITDPREVYFYLGCTTHRVVDAKGVVHCVPAIGFYGCALTWVPLADAPYVSF